MLKYTRGYFKKIIPLQNSLVIEISGCTHDCQDCKNKSRQNEDGQILNKEAIRLALDSFKRYIDSICFVGGEYTQAELKELCKYVHSEKLDTCLLTTQSSFSDISKNLINELDYIIVGRCDEQGIVYKKDFCPFADTYDWIEAKDWNTLVK